MSPPALLTQTLTPSKMTPKGRWPTGKVPTTLPSLARNLVTLAPLPVGYPKVNPVEGQADGPASDLEGAQTDPIAGA